MDAFKKSQTIQSIASNTTVSRANLFQPISRKYLHDRAVPYPV